MKKGGRPRLADETLMLGVMVPAEMHAQLQALAKRCKCTMSSIVRELLGTYLARAEAVSMRSSISWQSTASILQNMDELAREIAKVAGPPRDIVVPASPRLLRMLFHDDPLSCLGWNLSAVGQVATPRPT